MAERQSPQVMPAQPDRDDTSAKQSAAMDKQPFANALRAVMLGADFLAFRAVGAEECERLGVIAAASHAVTELPNGSDNFDSQSVFAWMRRVLPGDRGAVLQVRAITATANARVR